MKINLVIDDQIKKKLFSGFQIIAIFASVDQVKYKNGNNGHKRTVIKTVTVSILFLFAQANGKHFYCKRNNTTTECNSLWREPPVIEFLTIVQQSDKCTCEIS